MDISSWISVGSYWAAAALGLWLASAVTWAMMEFTMQRNCRREGDANRQTAAPDDQMVRWHIAHLRDDIAMVAVGIGVTNSLLGAILGVLLFRGLHGGS